MKFDIFGPEKYKKYANDMIAKQYVRKDIGVSVVDNGWLPLMI